jgi:hypothetical protein
MAARRGLKTFDVLVAAVVGSASAVYIWGPSLQQAQRERQQAAAVAAKAVNGDPNLGQQPTVGRLLHDREDETNSGKT